MADCCMLYNMCKVELFVLTILKEDYYYYYYLTSLPMICVEHLLRTCWRRVHVYQQPRAMRLAEETF